MEPPKKGRFKLKKAWAKFVGALKSDSVVGERVHMTTQPQPSAVDVSAGKNWNKGSAYLASNSGPLISVQYKDSSVQSGSVCSASALLASPPLAPPPKPIHRERGSERYRACTSTSMLDASLGGTSISNGSHAAEPSSPALMGTSPASSGLLGLWAHAKGVWGSSTGSSLQNSTLPQQGQHFARDSTNSATSPSCRSHRSFFHKPLVSPVASPSVSKVGGMPARPAGYLDSERGAAIAQSPATPVCCASMPSPSPLMLAAQAGAPSILQAMKHAPTTFDNVQQALADSGNNNTEQSGGLVVLNTHTSMSQIPEEPCDPANADFLHKGGNTDASGQCFDDEIMDWSSASSLPLSTSYRQAAQAQAQQAPLLSPAVTRLIHMPQALLHMAPQLPNGMRRDFWKLGDYQLVRKLYKGYSSSVYKAICTRSQQPVALKVYAVGHLTDFLRHQVFREVEVHRRLQHRNIVQLYGVFREQQYLVLVQEYARGGDLHRVVKKIGGRVPERQAVETVLHPFMQALSYVHSMGIVHRDIKPENILFTENWELKLGDFGVSVDTRSERAVTRTGTNDYMAPEVTRCPLKRLPTDYKDVPGLAYTPAADIWSVGVMAYELLVGLTPTIIMQAKETAPAAAAGVSGNAGSGSAMSSAAAIANELSIQRRPSSPDAPRTPAPASPLKATPCDTNNAHRSSSNDSSHATPPISALEAAIRAATPGNSGSKERRLLAPVPESPLTGSTPVAVSGVAAAVGSSAAEAAAPAAVHEVEVGVHVTPIGSAAAGHTPFSQLSIAAAAMQAGGPAVTMAAALPPAVVPAVRTVVMPAGAGADGSTPLTQQNLSQLARTGSTTGTIGAADTATVTASSCASVSANSQTSSNTANTNTATTMIAASSLAAAASVMSSTAAAAAAAPTAAPRSAIKPLPFPASVSPLARDFIMRALSPCPADRPTSLELLNHDLMRGMRKSMSVTNNMNNMQYNVGSSGDGSSSTGVVVNSQAAVAAAEVQQQQVMLIKAKLAALAAPSAAGPVAARGASLASLRCDPAAAR